MVATTTYHWSPISIYKRICCWLNQILTQEIRLVIAIVMPSRHVAKRHRRTLLARQGFAQHDQSPNWSDCNTKYIIISVKGEPRAMIQHDCPDSTLCRTPKVTTSSIDFKGSLWEVQPTLFKCIYIFIALDPCTIWAIGSFLVNVFFTLQLVWITQQKTLKINATLASGPQLLPSRSHLAILGPAGRRTHSTHKKWLVTLHPTKSLKYPNCT